jgi:hypothetical protein
MKDLRFDNLAKAFAGIGTPRRRFLAWAGMGWVASGAVVPRASSAAQNAGGCIPNIAEVNETMPGALFVHFTDEQWKQATANWAGVIEGEDQPEVRGTLDAVPMPGQRGGLLVAPVLHCPEPCLPIWQYKEFSPGSGGIDEAWAGLVPDCGCDHGCDREGNGDSPPPVLPRLCAEPEACRLVIRLDPAPEGLRGPIPVVMCENSTCPQCELGAVRRAGSPLEPGELLSPAQGHQLCCVCGSDLSEEDWSTKNENPP